MPAEALFTGPARTHVRDLIRALAPLAPALERKCRTKLKRRGYDPAVRRVFLAMAPSSLARLGRLNRFLEEVEYQARRLAKHNLPPTEVKEVIRELESVLDPVLKDRFRPSREQLHLATVLVVDRAFYMVREAETQALFGIYRAEAEARDVDDLLRRVAEVLARTFRAHSARVAVGAGLDGCLRRPRFLERGTPGEELIVDRDTMPKGRSFWSYPFGDGAVLQLGFTAFYPWLPRERTLLEMAADRCRGAIERARLVADVRRLESEARHAEQEERRRIGRELHDETGQSLMLLRLQLEMMERQSGPDLAGRLRESRALVENTVVELRRLIAALSPTALERLGLVSALRHLVTRFRESSPAAVRVRIQGHAGTIPRQIQDALYRTAQECLQNIRRHSRATAVNLSLTIADNNIRLRVSDNGSGFEVGGASGGLSFGLNGMRERAVLLGGMLKIRSRPGTGTSVSLELPRDAARVKSDVEDSNTVD